MKLHQTNEYVQEFMIVPTKLSSDLTLKVLNF